MMHQVYWYIQNEAWNVCFMLVILDRALAGIQESPEWINALLDKRSDRLDILSRYAHHHQFKIRNILFRLDMI